DGRELHVAHAHPSRVEEGRQKQEPAGTGRRGGPFGKAARVGGGGDAYAEQRADEEDRVRDHPALEVGERDRSEDGDEDEAERERGRIAVKDERRRGESRPDSELDQ